MGTCCSSELQSESRSCTCQTLSDDPASDAAACCSQFLLDAAAHWTIFCDRFRPNWDPNSHSFKESAIRTFVGNCSCRKSTMITYGGVLKMEVPQIIINHPSHFTSQLKQLKPMVTWGREVLPHISSGATFGSIEILHNSSQGAASSQMRRSNSRQPKHPTCIIHRPGGGHLKHWYSLHIIYIIQIPSNLLEVRKRWWPKCQVARLFLTC